MNEQYRYTQMRKEKLLAKEDITLSDSIEELDFKYKRNWRKSSCFQR